MNRRKGHGRVYGRRGERGGADTCIVSCMFLNVHGFMLIENAESVVSRAAVLLLVVVVGRRRLARRSCQETPWVEVQQVDGPSLADVSQENDISVNVV